MTIPADDLLDETFEDEETEEIDPEEHKKANRNLQNHNKRLEKENQELRAQLIGVHLNDLGLDPEKGLGKAIAKEYKGEMTAEAVATFAREEYQHETATPEAPPEVVQTQNIDTLNTQGASPVPTPQPTPEQIAAEKMHDPDASREEASQSLTAKVGDFVQKHYGTEGPAAPSQT